MSYKQARPRLQEDVRHAAVGGHAKLKHSGTWCTAVLQCLLLILLQKPNVTPTAGVPTACGKSLGYERATLRAFLPGLTFSFFILRHVLMMPYTLKCILISCAGFGVTRVKYGPEISLR